MWRIPGLIAVVFAFTGCTTSVLEMRTAAPGAELWGYRTLVVADVGTWGDAVRREAEETFAGVIPGAVSADALESGEAGFDEADEEDRRTWDTVVNVSLVDGSWNRYRVGQLDETGVWYETGWRSDADFRVSVVRRADGREVLSMVIRCRAGSDLFEQLLEHAAERTGKELKKSGLFP